MEGQAAWVSVFALSEHKGIFFPSIWHALHQPALYMQKTDLTLTLWRKSC